LHIVAAILLLIIGVIWPLASLLWLSSRLNRTPTLSSQRLGLILALNLIFPISLILSAFGLLLPQLRESLAFKGALVVAWVATLGLFAGLWWSRTAEHRVSGGEKG
jgi:hypothetical protein